jgi:hypothetical protein
LDGFITITKSNALIEEDSIAMSWFRAILVLPAAVLAVTNQQCDCSCCETVSVDSSYRCGNILHYTPRTNGNTQFRGEDVHRDCSGTCSSSGVEVDNAKFCYDSCFPPQDVFMGALCQAEKPSFYQPKPVHHLAMRRQGLRQTDLSQTVVAEQSGAELVAEASNAANAAGTAAGNVEMALDQIRSTADKVYQQVSAVKYAFLKVQCCSM